MKYLFSFSIYLYLLYLLAYDAHLNKPNLYHNTSIQCFGYTKGTVMNLVYCHVISHWEERDKITTTRI